MIYKIIFSTLAGEDLRSIKKYICCDNYKAAREVVKHIFECIDYLKNNPSIGRAGRILGTRELVISKYPYIVPYQAKEDIIYILRVLHTSKKW